MSRHRSTNVRPMAFQGSLPNDSPLDSTPETSWIDRVALIGAPKRLSRVFERFSVFSHGIERPTYVACFLGAGVPLVALGIGIERYALSREDWMVHYIWLFGSISLLLLGCFLMLRRVAQRAAALTEMDHQTSESLAAISHQLATALDVADACGSTARGALTLTDADASYVILAEGGDLRLQGSAGANARRVYEDFGESLEILVGVAIESGEPSLLGPEECSTGRTAGEISSIATIPLRVGRRSSGALAVVHGSSNSRLGGRKFDALQALGGIASVAIGNVQLGALQQNFFSHVTDLLVTLIDEHLDYNQGHARRVARFSHTLGRGLGLDEDSLRRLHFAALLHDIGMLRIDPTLRHDARSCRRHAGLGYRMLSGIQLWEGVADCVLHHHEWFDGTGYPSGLTGTEIPLESRIVSVCDAFDAMTSSSSYRDPISCADAARRIRLCAGTQFDPDVVRAFATLVRSGSILADHVVVEPS